MQKILQRVKKRDLENAEGQKRDIAKINKFVKTQTVNKMKSRRLKVSKSLGLQQLHLKYGKKKVDLKKVQEKKNILAFQKSLAAKAKLKIQVQQVESIQEEEAEDGAITIESLSKQDHKLGTDP